LKQKETKNPHLFGASLYVMASIISFGIMIITLPIYTRLLNPEEFGITIVFVLFGKFVCGFFHFSLHDSTYRYYFDYKNQFEKFKILNSTNLLFLFFSFLICYLLIFFTTDLFYEKIFDGQLNKQLISLSLISGFLDYIFLYFMTLLTAELKAKQHTYLSILFISLNSAFSIFFMSYYDLTYMGRVYGIILSQFIVAAILIKICFHTISFQFSVKMLKMSFKYALPYYPIMLLGLSQNYLDKTILSSSKGNESLAQYTIGINFSVILKSIMDAVSKSWNAYMISTALINTKESKKDIVEKFYYMAVFFMTLGVGIAYFSEEAIKILTTKEYHVAIWITPIYIYFYLFAIVGYLTNMQLSIAEKMKFLIPGTIVSGIINITLNLLLIPIYGMIGAAIAAAFTSMVSQLFLFYYGMKVFPLEINKRKLLKLYGLLFVFTLPAYFIYALEINFIYKIFIKLFGVYMFVKLCLINKFINKEFILIVMNDYKYLNKLTPILNKIF
jgi:O-antigen/teichoic acid export membrane protein